MLTCAGPFRIHPDDPPFVMPDHPWPSPNETAREKALAHLMSMMHCAGEFRISMPK